MGCAKLAVVALPRSLPGGSAAAVALRGFCHCYPDVVCVIYWQHLLSASKAKLCSVQLVPCLSKKMPDLLCAIHHLPTQI
jgi:hypothetical protein